VKLVAVENLTIGMVVGKDIPLADSFTPLVRKNTLLTGNLIALMREHNLQHVYILDPEEQKKAESASLIHIPQKPPLISPQLKEDAIKSLSELFELVSLGVMGHQSPSQNTSINTIRDLNRVVDQLITSLESDKGALVNITSLKKFDEYTFHHSLSVAVLALAIAQRLGFDRISLSRIGKCAIMHDIGKTAVPLDIIHKPSTLDAREFELIKEHSAAGYDFLCRSILNDEEISLGVLYHHERVDGFGYPNGLKENDIPLWSRIISVADVYDAITSNRPYRLPMQPAAALEYIMGGSGTIFDYDVVNAFLCKIELYPIGSQVELSNGKMAIVCGNDHPMRPMVRLLPNGEFLDLYRDRNCLDIVILKLVS